MKIAQMEQNTVYWITPYKTWDEVPPFSPEIHLQEIPVDVGEGWRYVGEEWLEPEPVETPAQTLPPEDIISLAIADLYAQNLEILASLKEGGAVNG